MTFPRGYRVRYTVMSEGGPRSGTVRVSASNRVAAKTQAARRVRRMYPNRLPGSVRTYWTRVPPGP